MATAKKAPPQVAVVDPAALGALIPEEGAGGNDEETLVTIGSNEAPPLLRHEPTPPPPSQSLWGASNKKKPPAAQASPPAPVVQPKRDIAKMLPSSHRIHVYKKKDNGKLSYLNEYSAQELQGSGTIEAFIKKYVVPEYEFGTFQVYYFDGQNRDPNPVGEVNIEAPVNHKPDSKGTVAEVLRELSEIQKQTQTTAKSPMDDMMQAMMAQMFQNQMSKMTSGEKPDSKSENGMGNMLMMMMMMDRMKPAQPAVDPAMQRLMEKMMERIDNMEQEVRVSQAMVPPPPPPPSEGPSNIEVILETMRENNKLLVEAMRSGQRDPIKDLADMAQLMAPKNNESLTTKDLLELMPKFKMMLAPEQSKDPFEKTVENFRLFKLMQREFGEDSRQQHAPQQPEESFWSFAKSMIQSDVGKSIAAQIMQQGAGQQIQQHQQNRTVNARANAHEVARRRAAQAAQHRQLAEARAHHLAEDARSAQEAARQEHAAAQATPPPAPPPQTPAMEPEQPPVQAQPQPQPPVQAQQPPEPKAQGDDDEGVDVPPGFIDVHLPAINGAPNDAERIGAIITGFQVLATSNDFRPVIVKMFGLCKQNRRIEALEHLKEILEFFVENEVMDPKLPQTAVEDFDRHWALIRQRLDFPDVPEVLPPAEESEAASA